MLLLVIAPSAFYLTGLASVVASVSAPPSVDSAVLLLDSGLNPNPLSLPSKPSLTKVGLTIPPDHPPSLFSLIRIAKLAAIFSSKILTSRSEY
jgi:hypothetical protein